MTVVRHTGAMIAGMTPVLVPGAAHFCTIAADEPRVADLRPDAIGRFREGEGLSLILPDVVAKAAGLAGDQPMRQITLQVYSALDGVGLTAAVSTVLADAGIACNMVAAYHHDHAFVPAKDAARALDVLKAAAAQA